MTVQRLGRAPYHGTTPVAREQAEGCLAQMIETQTARLPSDFFLWCAVAASLGASTLKMAGRHHAALFVGQWVSPLLAMGVYDKIVKVVGSDRMSEINVGG